MCGIVGLLDRTGRLESTSGRIVFAALEALACRGPDGTGVAFIGPASDPNGEGVWSVRIAAADERVLERLAPCGQLVPMPDGAAWARQGNTLRFRFLPQPGVTASDLERALGARRGGLEVLSLGCALDLVKEAGSPKQLEAAYGVSSWRGRIAIGHTRLSTESRIDLAHSQPFWVHGTPDLAAVHNGHVTNYHQLRRRYEQQGTTFYTDNDSEVIGVYLRARMRAGRSLPDAMADSIADLDGSYNYLVASREGLGIVRDRFGLKPLMLVETEDYIATATEEVALRAALPGEYCVVEPPPGASLFYPMALEHAALV
jgi:glutamine phosphoribosylpyrophosphate amidotransferase